MKFPKFKGVSQTPQTKETPDVPVVPVTSSPSDDVLNPDNPPVPAPPTAPPPPSSQPLPEPNSETNPPAGPSVETAAPVVAAPEELLPFYGVPPPPQPVPSSSSEISTETHKEGKKNFFQRLKKHNRKPSIDVAFPKLDTSTPEVVTPPIPPAELHTIIDKDKAERDAEKKEERRKQHYLDTLHGFTPEPNPDARNEDKPDPESEEKSNNENDKQLEVKRPELGMPIKGQNLNEENAAGGVENHSIMDSYRQYPSITQGLPRNFQHDFMASHSGPAPNAQPYLRNEYSFSVTPATAPLYMSPPSPGSNPPQAAYPSNDAVPTSSATPGEDPSKMAEMFASRAFGGAGNSNTPFPTVPALVPPPPPRETAQHDFLVGGDGGSGNSSPLIRSAPIGWGSAHSSVPSHPLTGLPQAFAPPAHGPLDLEPVLAEKIRRGRELGMLAVEQEEKGNMGAAEAGYIKALSLLVPASKELDTGPEVSRHIRMKHKAKIKREAAAMLDRCEELHLFLAANGPAVPDEMPVFPGGDSSGGSGGGSGGGSDEPKQPSSSKPRLNDKNMPPPPPPPTFTDEILISRLENRKNVLPGVGADESQSTNEKNLNKNSSSRQSARDPSPPGTRSFLHGTSPPLSNRPVTKLSSHQELSSELPSMENAPDEQLPTDEFSSMYISGNPARSTLPQDPSPQQHQQVVKQEQPWREHDSSQYSTPSSNMPTLDITVPLSSPPPLPLPPSMHSAGHLGKPAESLQKGDDVPKSNTGGSAVSKCFLCGAAADLQTKCRHLFCSNCGNQVASVFEHCPVPACNKPLAVEDFEHIVS